MKNRIVYLLQEIAIVVVGVLIAVSISNYQEEKENQRYIEKTLLAIESEIRLSQTDLDTVLKRHLSIAEYLENNESKKEQTLGEMIYSLGGFQVASIKNISLRFFVANKAELLDFEVISQLLEIEFQTDILSDKLERLTDFVYEHVNESSVDTKLKFAIFLSDVIDSEQTLLASYADLLDESERYLKGDAASK